MRTIYIAKPNHNDDCPECGSPDPYYWNPKEERKYYNFNFGQKRFEGVMVTELRCTCKKCGHNYVIINPSGFNAVKVRIDIPETEGEEICRP
jgi:hypothetical protein